MGDLKEGNITVSGVLTKLEWEKLKKFAGWDNESVSKTVAKALRLYIKSREVYLENEPQTGGKTSNE